MKVIFSDLQFSLEEAILISLFFNFFAAIDVVPATAPAKRLE